MIKTNNLENQVSNTAELKLNKSVIKQNHPIFKGNLVIWKKQWILIIVYQQGKYTNSACKYIMVFCPSVLVLEEIDLVIKVSLSELTKKDIGRLPSAEVKPKLVEEVLVKWS